MRAPWRVVAGSLLVVMVAGCTASPPTALPIGSPVPDEPLAYVAVGASETVGVGTDDPVREAWPRVLWRTAMPQAAFFNLGVAGSTTAQALQEQVPAALAAHPDIVTVWLNVNDLIARVPPEVYQRQLTRLVRRLRQGDETQVLIASTPRLDSLPAYRACRPSPPAGSAPCPLEGSTVVPPLPPRGVVQAAVAAYNRVIVRVVRRQGAILVDLRVFGDAPRTHPGYVAADGFHPSAAGAQAIAGVFARAVAGVIPSAAPS